MAAGSYSSSFSAKAEAMESLWRAWYHLRVSVRDPARVGTWDAVIVTAASPEQARLFQWQLRRAARVRQIIAERTLALAVPDPCGARIGSGAATLSALRALLLHLRHASSTAPVSSESEVDKDACCLDVDNALANMRVLLVHAGGDSKRVPWANPMGKAFIPLPYMAEEDPDGPVPLLFDHILAISSPVLKAFGDKGGVFIMTGDVLPCFDLSCMVLPENGACVVTVPATVDIAGNHGVIVPSSMKSHADNHKNLDIVENLLQKPTLEQLVDNQALRSDGRALLDTGIFAVRGKAWQDIIKLSSTCQVLIDEIISRKEEVSLYEELAAAWVPAKQEWLKTRPLGPSLIKALGNERLFTYCANDLLFLHFGTTSEVLDHLGESNSSGISRRHLSSIPASTVCDLATSAVILSSEIASGVSIGDDSLVYDSTLSSGVQIGSRCVVVGLHLEQSGNKSYGSSPLLLLPDRHCLWEVPLLGHEARVILCCGIEDNPKSTIKSGGTFCGQVWDKIFSELGICESDVWNHTQDSKCLWNARLFPVLQKNENLQLIMWLMGLNIFPKNDMLNLWKTCKRVSLEEIHRNIDFEHLCTEASNHRAKLAAGIAKACISYGLLGRNLSRLCTEIVEGETFGADMCNDFLALCPDPQTTKMLNLPQSRAYQAQLDLCRACGLESKAKAIERMVWESVAAETAIAVKHDFGDQVPISLRSNAKQAYKENGYQSDCNQSCILKRTRVELPVRVDFVGGWSDTPPWSLERTGCVLNMAIHLNGICPVGAEIVVTSIHGILINDDAGNSLHIDDLKSISPPFPEADKFRLVKAALLVTGILDSYEEFLGTGGLEIRTWASVPRGSGLGTSSILAAAVVKGVMKAIGGDESNENVARLVLVLEQLMGTGGGWQDQIGGLYPGIKFTRSIPGKPLRLNVETVLMRSHLIKQLQERMLVIFTGQVRLAHQVLQKVVIRYLQRDACLIKSIKELARLAKVGRELLMNGNLDGLGSVMLQAWRLHQELDPYCSNELVDNVFDYAKPFCCGYKLVGAGGGGFALLLAKSKDDAEHLKGLLAASKFPVEVYNWSIC